MSGVGEDADGALSDTEARLVEAAWREAAASAPGRRMQGVGCLLAFGGMAALTLTPGLGNFVSVAPDTAYAVLALAVLLLGSGATLGLLGAGRSSSSDGPAMETAVERVVAAHAAGREGVVAEAAVLLARMRDRRPGAPSVDLADRLGPALDDVRRVRAFLVARGHLPPG